MVHGPGEIGFDVVGPYGDTLLSHTAGSSLPTQWTIALAHSWLTVALVLSSQACLTLRTLTTPHLGLLMATTASLTLAGRRLQVQALFTAGLALQEAHRLQVLVHCQALAEQVNTSTQSPRMELLELLQR